MPSEPVLPIGDILDVVRQHVTDPVALKAIVDDLNAAQRENAAAKAAEKEDGAANKNKYRLVVMIRGDASLKPLLAGGAFILAVPDTEDGSLGETYSGDSLLQRLYRAVRTFNDAPKGKRGRTRTKMKTFVEAMRMLKPKAIKEAESEFKIKTPDAVEVVVVEKEEI